MDHGSVLGPAAGRVDAPRLRGRRDQHRARHGAGLPERLVERGNGGRAACCLESELRIGVKLVVRRRVFHRDLVGLHFQLFRDQHRHRRVDALPDLDLRNDGGHVAGLVDPDEGARREVRSRRVRSRAICAEHRRVDRNQQAAPGGDAGAQEGTPRQPGVDGRCLGGKTLHVHFQPPCFALPSSFAAYLIASRMRT